MKRFISKCVCSEQRLINNSPAASFVSAAKQRFLLVSFALLVIASPAKAETDTPLLLSNPGDQVYNEEQSYTLNISAAAGARIFVSGMPPGMSWNETGRQFDFRPDFIQGGKSWQVTMEAHGSGNISTETFLVTINNNIQPPWPTVVAEEYLSFPRMTKYTLTQVTDNFLDSPGNVGREFRSTMVVPDAASTENLLPLAIWLHGFGGSAGTGGGRELFAISPHDSNNTWWTGYNDQFPDGDATEGTVPNYTQRRVMHLLAYLVENYPGVDLDRVSIGGQSMGGTGAHFTALRYARHFASVFSRIGGTAAQLLSTGQRGMLRNHWGSIEPELLDDTGMSVWAYYDASRGLLADRDFRNLHFSTVMGQNDPTINFRHIVGQSPVTNISFVNALQQEGIGHHIVWDQRAHGVSEGPPLGSTWWEPLDEASAAFARNQAFPAFSNSSADDDPGVVDGAGGFTGRLRGVINRYQRWDSTNIVDTRELFSIPIRVDIDTSGTPPAAQFPPRDNYYYGSTPITTDVTMRRVQNFQLLAGEAVNWEYNGASGVVFANADGSVTVPGLAMATTNTELKLLRTLEAVSPSITTQPSSQSIDAGGSVTFTIEAAGSVPLSFQWFRDGGIIDGATSPSYTLNNVLADDNQAVFHCVVTNNLGDAVSDDARLTVLSDTTAPLIEMATAVSLNQVDIRFNEAVTSASAEAVSNYQIDRGIIISGAVLNIDNQTVHLTTSALDAGLVYTATINNIQDTSPSANEILPDSRVSFEFEPTINFDNGLWPSGWVPLNQSRWSVAADNGNNALFLNTTDYSPLSGNRLGEYVISPDSYTDFLLQVLIRTNEGLGNANADYALIFGFEDSSNYFYMMFNRTQSNTQLFKVINGTRENLATTTTNWLTDNEYHAVEISRIADAIEVRFDGNLVLHATDATFPVGKLGLGSFNDAAYFDDIRISTGSGEASDLVFADEFE